MSSFDHMLVTRKRWELKNWKREPMLRKWRGKEVKVGGIAQKRHRKRRRRMEKKCNK